MLGMRCSIMVGMEDVGLGKYIKVRVSWYDPFDDPFPPLTSRRLGWGKERNGTKL